MEFTLDGETQMLLPGMGAFIASNVLHGAKAVTACKVIDVFTPVREDYKELQCDKISKLIIQFTIRAVQNRW